MLQRLLKPLCRIIVMIENLKLKNKESVIADINPTLDRMEGLGINQEMLTQSMLSGLSQYRSASDLEPLNAGGSKASFVIVQTLREQLLSNGLGWKMVNQKGQCLTVNSDNKISIITTSGDKYTGLNDGCGGKKPCTRNGKGLETKIQVIKNQGQTLCLFEQGLITDRECKSEGIIESADDNQLWFLLYYFDFGKKEVRFELSLPVGVKTTGNQGKVKVSNWSERLIFSPLPFGESSTTDKLPEFDKDIEFNVTQKE